VYAVDREAVSALRQLWDDEDFGFRLILKRGRLAEFFAPTPASSERLAERKRWLIAAPEDYVAESKSGAVVWQEFAELVEQWTGVSMPPRACQVGAGVEPDVVFLRRDAEGVFRITDGVVVFPTSWAFSEKIGLTLAETHGVVPGLNAAIGPAIDRFLHGLKPGVVAARSNWGMAATAELNLHPGLKRPRLTAEVQPDMTWIRVEHQILTVLPRTGAVMFGIRIALHPLTEVLAGVSSMAGLHRALSTMPPPVADYKGLAAAMPELLRLTT
jgi:hypothetical protein